MTLEINKNMIMAWMRENHSRTILMASEEFCITPQQVHDILDKKTF